MMCYSPVEEEIRLRAYFRPAAGEMNLTKQILSNKTASGAMLWYNKPVNIILSDQSTITLPHVSVVLQISKLKSHQA